MTRTFDTAEGALETLDTPMECLDLGDIIVGPDGQTVYEVIERCCDNGNGWLFVRDLGADRVWDERERCWSDEGFFSYAPGTAMHLVLDQIDA